MDVRVKLSDSKLVAKDIDAVQATAIIEGFFRVVGSLTKEPKHIELSPVINVLGDAEKQSIAETFASSAAKAVSKSHRVGLKKSAPTVQNPPKVLPKIDDNRTLEVSIGERLESQTAEEQEHWKSGIKLKEAVPHYRAKYWCDCGSTGKRYVPKDAEFLQCRECNEKLQVEPATLETQENGLPVRDDWGNFYIAREAYEAVN